MSEFLVARAMAAPSYSAFCCNTLTSASRFVTANEQAGKAVGEVHRNLHGLTDLRFTDSPGDLNKLDDRLCLSRAYLMDRRWRLRRSYRLM